MSATTCLRALSDHELLGRMQLGVVGTALEAELARRLHKALGLVSHLRAEVMMLEAEIDELARPPDPELDDAPAATNDGGTEEQARKGASTVDHRETADNWSRQ
jgi:hypothetical protein